MSFIRTASARPTLIQRLLSLCGGAAAPGPAGFQPLEARQMLAATVIDDFDDITVGMNAGPAVIELAPRITDPALNGNIIRFASNMGDIFVQLYNNETPLSVTNFMQYVNSDANSAFTYNNAIIHRAATLGNGEQFVVQGGGFRYSEADIFTSISPFPFVNNEHRPNTALRGTISYAKRGDNPNSASNQFFFNLRDNSDILDDQNGGFTTFGRVLGSGMTIVDAMAALPRFNFEPGNPNTPFGEVPLRNYVNGQPYVPDNFVTFSTITLTSRMTYTVTVADPTKVSAQIIEGNLSLSYVANATGTTTVTVTGTSRDGGESVSDTFTVNIGGPTVEATQASAAMVQPGTGFTMTSTGVVDQGSGTVAGVQYWRDANANGTFEADSDLLIETATSAEGNWARTIPTGGTASGLYTYFARPVDNDGIFGTVASTQVRLNANPTLGGVSSSASSIQQGQQIDLTAVNPTDSDNAIERVRYYRDVNGNGTLELDVDTELGQSTSDGTNFRTRVGTSGIPVGAFTILARAEDEFDALSDVVATTVNVVANPPTLTSVRANPALIPNAGVPVVLTSSGYRDRDGTVAGIEYWRDNGDGVFNTETDTFLGGSTTARGGYRFEASTTDFAPGTYTFFGRAVDNSGLFSTAVATTARINAAPTIAGLGSDTGSVERLAFLTLTASGVADDTTVRSVTFYRETDGVEGLNTATERSIGRGRRNADGTWSLRINTRGFATGQNTFYAVATDANNGVSAAAPHTVTVVNALPTAAGITVRPTIVANVGDPLTLTVRTPKDRDGTISLVRYYLDTNNNGSIDIDGPTQDVWLGENSRRSYAITRNADAVFAVGANTVLAVVIDNDGGSSAPASAQVFINAAPTIEFVVAPDATVTNGERFTVGAGNVADADGTVRSVDFFIDTNRDGEFTFGTDRSLGKGRNVNGLWSLTTSVRNVSAGPLSIFARATDNNRGLSAVSESEIIIA